MNPSEEVGLLHNAEELLLVDLTVAITVSLIDHLLKLLISHPLAELLGHTLQVLERDLAGLIIIEQAEGLENLILRITIQNLVGHHLQELFVLDGAASVIIDIGDHLLNLLFLWLESKGAHGDLQLLGIDGARAIGIKEVKGLLDLLLLLLSQLLLLLATSVETTQGHCCKRCGECKGKLEL